MKDYKEMCDDLQDACFDIEDILDGSSNDWSIAEFGEAENLYQFCKLYVKLFNEYSHKIKKQ